MAADLVRKQYVFTLFLARLFHDDDVPWVLLGGNALLIRTGGGRFTRDVDIARETNWPSSEAVLEELRTLVSDGRDEGPFEFILKNITRHSEPDEDGYGAVTAKVQADAFLGGLSFESFSIDLTTRRHTDAPVDHVPLNQIIDHDSLHNLPSVPTIPVENHLADKLCAMYERYGASEDTPSTRYRDLADIVRMIQGTSFEAARLVVVLEREAGRRQMKLPDSVASPDESWRSGFPTAARTFAEYPAELVTLDASLGVAAHCLNGVLEGTRVNGKWDPTQQSWADETT